ncbi:hypothetical protein JCM21900_000254 [Sporobolomyces salmonicolor]
MRGPKRQAAAEASSYMEASEDGNNAEQMATARQLAVVEPAEGHGADSVDKEHTHSLDVDDTEAAPAAVLPGDLPILLDTDVGLWPYGLGVRSDKLVLYPTSDRDGKVPRGCGTAPIPLDEIAFITPNGQERQGEGMRYEMVVLQRPRSRSGPEGPPLPSVKSWGFVLDASCPASRLSSLHHALARACVTLPPSGFKPPRTLVVALNPAGGSHLAPPYFDDVVQRLLEPVAHWVKLEKEGARETQLDKDGERIGRELVESWRGEEGEERKTVLVMGGDGTVHEVLNGMLLGEEGEGDKEAAKVLVDLIVIPCGTANALYHHLCPPESSLYPSSSPLSPFYSFLSFLRQHSSSSPLPLALALNTILPSPTSSSKSKTVLTSVVSSAALHACLLHDAESLRATMPGLERFKVAAQKNVKLWWDGRLRLFGNVRRYDPQQKALVPAAAAVEEEEKDLELEGPFAYLVSSLVSRFEPTFVVAPLRSPLSPLAPSPSEKPTIDLVLIRPLRHRPTAALVKKGKDEEAKTGFAQRVWGVTAGMYDSGRHVDMRYEAGEGAEDAEEEEEGRTSVVEVYRCEGFEWVPSPSRDLKSNLVCLDGALHDLGEGGKLKTVALGFAETGVRVWS